MTAEEAYDRWAAQYDSNVNRTRDLEAVALRSVLVAVKAERCLEIGCGTGKNTVWLAEHCTQVTAVDFSSGMLACARKKFAPDQVRFVRADINDQWDFVDGSYDLVTFSLVLEHINDLDHVLRNAAQCLTIGGYAYIGELHPFKQYNGTKARFESENGTQVVPCYDHHVSDFTGAAHRAGLEIVELNEHFDDDDRRTVPRIISLLLTTKYRPIGPCHHPHAASH